MKRAVVMPCLLLAGAALGPAGCAAEDRAATRPIFSTDAAATGPLTLEELQLNLPTLGIGDQEATTACVQAAVARRAAEAGDPVQLDPEAFPYWGGRLNQEGWKQLGAPMQRVLLAQAIVTWGMLDC